MLHTKLARSAARLTSRLPTNGCRGKPGTLHLSLPRAAQSPQLGAADATDDFYSILGLTPNADSQAIKKAYYGMMRECHPDLSQDDESTELCMMLNEIYETLTDPAQRAVYDSIVGLSIEQTNPFMDTTSPANKVFVDEYTCIGCRNCTCVSPKTFEIEEDFGRARATGQHADDPEKVQEAIDTCPVSCIHWVTSEQLPWLEQAMGQMGRAAVWSMMSGGGRSGSVFSEASHAWDERRIALQARVDEERNTAFWTSQAASAPNFDFGFGFGFGGSSKQPQGGPGGSARQQHAGSYGSPGGPPVDRRLGALVARAAAASKRWQLHKTVTKAKETNIIPY